MITARYIGRKYYFCAQNNEQNDFIMSEKQKQVEKERKAVLQLLLEKTGLKYKEVVDFQLGVWMAGHLDLLTAEEKKQFPHLAF